MLQKDYTHFQIRCIHQTNGLNYLLNSVKNIQSLGENVGKLKFILSLLAKPSFSLKKNIGICHACADRHPDFGINGISFLVFMTMEFSLENIGLLFQVFSCVDSHFRGNDVNNVVHIL